MSSTIAVRRNNQKRGYSRSFVPEFSSYDNREEVNGYRYGFNGMEKDDQVKGRGNSYDFGARMYDSRLGKFLSRDRYADQFAGESPYIYAGNSPIMCKDLGGNFKIVVTEEAKKEKGSEIKIARFEAIVKDLENYLNQNPLVLDKIVEQTGLTKAEVMAASKFGSGPTIYITTNDAGAEATPTSFQKLESGFEIDYTLIESLENHKSTNALENALVNLVFGALVLHEFTHWGDRKSNDGNITGQSNGDLFNADGTPNCGEQKVCSSNDHRGIDVDNRVLSPISIGVAGGVIRDVDGLRKGANFHYVLKDINKIPATLEKSADPAKIKNVLPKDQSKPKF